MHYYILIYRYRLCQIVNLCRVENNSSALPNTSHSSDTQNLCDVLWTIHTETGFRSHQVSFYLNKTVFDTTMDGRKISMIVKPTRPNQWEEVQTNKENGKTTTLIRTFLRDKMFIEMFVSNVSSSSTFLRRT